MNIRLASHLGMCFGVRDAIQLTRQTAAVTPITVLGQLVHNPVISSQLENLGVAYASLDDPGPAPTRHVLITAHGASCAQKQRWMESGHLIIDTTCPLVRKAHHTLATLVQEGYHPVVIGTHGHVEVRGLVGDFPGALIVSTEEDAARLPFHSHFGVIAQTTQPISLAERIVARMRRRHPQAEVRFEDTVCQPTKSRQTALDRLCRESRNIVVIGGCNSNNTRQLLQRVQSLGCRACLVETAHDLDPSWFAEVVDVGVTAGTSTLPETVDEVVARLHEIASSLV